MSDPKKSHGPLPKFARAGEGSALPETDAMVMATEWTGVGAAPIMSDTQQSAIAGLYAMHTLEELDEAEKARRKD